jgi:opacity protein-like surface antigen
LFVSALCEIAAAAESSENKASGFYLGASVSRVEQDTDGEGQILISAGLFGSLIPVSPSRVSVDDRDIGWNVTLGYQVNKYIAAELAYYDFGAASVTEHYSSNLSLFPLNIDVRSNIDAFGPGVSLLGTLPLTPSVEIFARGGVLFLDQKIERQSGSFRSSHRTGDNIWMAGAGVQWSFTSRWAARLEYQLTDHIDLDSTAFVPQPGTSKIEQLSLGVTFDF